MEIKSADEKPLAPVLAAGKTYGTVSAHEFRGATGDSSIDERLFPLRRTLRHKITAAATLIKFVEACTKLFYFLCRQCEL